MTERYISTREAAQRARLHYNTVSWMCRNGRIDGAIKQITKHGNTSTGQWLIPYAARICRTRRPEFTMPEGYVSIREAADRLHYSYSHVLLHMREMAGVKKIGRVWCIPDASLGDFNNRVRKASPGGCTGRAPAIRPEGFVGVVAAAEIINRTPNYISRKLGNGRIKGAKKVGSVWHIPIASLEEFKNKEVTR